ncbi:hypothetical protein CEK71_04760 [Methylovulum psychrotolerans]|jgi:hypothetical protein|uniref:Uncharacterized protein n=1 Tax=Methylovulum psychrotolerans TaxID=1704499 RepID=A0A1Z4BVW3_9GAMM|nr:hypothetical protein CEK71_04760 [Methylovulum psychrotolerans]
MGEGKAKTMWQDPIVNETRALREEYAAKFNHDPDALFEDILKRQAQAGKKVVPLPPRKPLLTPKAA